VAGRSHALIVCRAQAPDRPSPHGPGPGAGDNRPRSSSQVVPQLERLDSARPGLFSGPKSNLRESFSRSRDRGQAASPNPSRRPPPWCRAPTSAVAGGVDDAIAYRVRRDDQWCRVVEVEALTDRHCLFADRTRRAVGVGEQGGTSLLMVIAIAALAGRQGAAIEAVCGAVRSVRGRPHTVQARRTVTCLPRQDR
jgi:hypothetical protein